MDTYQKPIFGRVVGNPLRDYFDRNQRQNTTPLFKFNSPRVPVECIVNEINDDSVLCDAIVGKVIIKIPFQKDRFYKNPSVDDVFNWFPTEEGSYTPQNFIVIKRRNEPKPELSDIEVEKRLGRFRELYLEQCKREVLSESLLPWSI